MYIILSFSFSREVMTAFEDDKQKLVDDVGRMFDE